MKRQYKRKTYTRKRRNNSNLMTVSKYRAMERKQWYKEHELQFYDISLSSSITSTGTIIDILEQIVDGLNTTSDPKFGELFTYEKVYISHGFISVAIAQSNTTTVTDDDYNYVRMICYSSPMATDDNTLTAILNIANPVLGAADTAVVNNMYFDKKVYLNRRPLTGAGSTSAPGNVFFNKRFAIGQTFKFINNSAGTTVANTEIGGIKLERVSDSTVTPHPSITGYIRIYYRVL